MRKYLIFLQVILFKNFFYVFKFLLMGFHEKCKSLSGVPRRQKVEEHCCRSCQYVHARAGRQSAVGETCLREISLSYFYMERVRKLKIVKLFVCFPLKDRRTKVKISFLLLTKDLFFAVKLVYKTYKRQCARIPFFAR